MYSMRVFCLAIKILIIIGFQTIVLKEYIKYMFLLVNICSHRFLIFLTDALSQTFGACPLKEDFTKNVIRRKQNNAQR